MVYKIWGFDDDYIQWHIVFNTINYAIVDK